MKRTLFLQAPSFDGYDGGAGARYQMKREVKSFWYPTWLAQPAAMVPGSKLIDAPAHELTWEDIAHEFDERDLVILHTSTPSFNQDMRTPKLIKERNPACMIGFVGAKVAVQPEESLTARRCVDFVAREEYDFTCVELAEGKPLAEVDGITWRAPDGSLVRNKDRAQHRGHGRACRWSRRLQARSRPHKVLRRLPAAPLYLVLHRPRLQEPLHFLPLAADDQRPPLPPSLGRPKWPRKSPTSCAKCPK